MRNQSTTTFHKQPGWMDSFQSDPSLRMLLGFGAFVLAVVMLAGFYVVIQQGVARAHTHWANATRVVSGCESDTRIGGRDICGLPGAGVRVLQVSAVR